MKFSRYIAVLATLAAASVASAQNAASEPNVSTTLKDGVLSVRADMNVTNPTVSCEDAIKSLVAATVKVTGKENMSTKSLEAAFGSILAALTDKNHPAQGNVVSSNSVKESFSGGQPVFDAVSTLEIAGEKYSAETKTVVASDGSVSTQGNVAVTTDRGENYTFPVTLSVDSQGNASGSVGEKSVATKVSPEEAGGVRASAPDTQNADRTKSLGGVDEPFPVPDNTRVISSSL